MPKNYIQNNQPEFTRLISSVIRDTFKAYFDMDVVADYPPVAANNLPDTVYCKAHIEGERLAGDVVVSLSHDTLLKLARKVYPPTLPLDNNAIEGCAEEITNIVGTRLKNFLSHQNFDASIGVPTLCTCPQSGSQLLHLSFTVENQPMMIDFIVEDERLHYSVTQH